MENLVFGGQQAPSAAYDYRVYDQVWKRVSPGLDPYAENPAGAGQPSGAAGAPVPPAMPPVAQPAAPQPVTPPSQGMGAAAGAANLPGADRNPCCMGSNARESLMVLEGFLEDELAGRRYAMALASGVRQQSMVRLRRNWRQPRSCARPTTSPPGTATAPPSRWSTCSSAAWRRPCAPCTTRRRAAA